METKHIVEYKPTRTNQVFLKYYLGYPLSYYPIILDNGHSGYTIIGALPLNGSFDRSIEKSDKTEVMVERITKVVDDFEARIDNDLITIEQHRVEKLKADALIEQERQFFKAIANREITPKPKSDDIVDLGSTKKEKESGLFRKLLGD